MNLSFLSTKSEKGSASISSDPSSYIKEPSEQERSQVPNYVAPSSSSGLIAGKVCHRKSLHFRFREKKPRCDHKCWYVLIFTVANEESNPSNGIKGFQSAVNQESEPTTAQRRRELEHYLKLKRYKTVIYKEPQSSR